MVFKFANAVALSQRSMVLRVVTILLTIYNVEISPLDLLNNLDIEMYIYP